MRSLGTVLFCGCIAASSWAQPARVICAEVPPFCYVADGVPQGGIYEAGQQMLQRLGYESQIEIMPLARALYTVQNEKGVISLWVGRTPEREKAVQWIAPMIRDAFYIYTLQGRPDASTMDKARQLKVLGANIAGANILAAQKNRLNSLEAISSDDSNGRKLLAERVDGWVASESAVAYFIRRRALAPSLLVRGVKLDNYVAYLSASLDVDKADVKRWQSVVRAMERDGSLAQLRKKYQIQDLPVAKAEPRTEQDRRGKGR